MSARSGPRTKSASSGAFDIRVLAFDGPSARTLHGLQAIFGVDVTTAQRIVDSVPSIVRRAAPAEEAQSYVTALQSLGAQVSLEAANHDAGSAASHLKLPAHRAPSCDLEFDVLSTEDVIEDEVGIVPPSAAEPDSLVPALCVAEDLPAVGAGPGLGDPAGLGEPRSAAEASAAAGHRLTRTMRREEIELETGGSAGLLDVDPEAARTRAPTELPAAAEDERPATRMQTAGMPRPNLGGSHPSTAVGPRAVTGKAAVFEHPETTRQAKRSRALFSLLAAIAAFALGVLFDNTILYGNASAFSVIAHGLALHQLGLGLWGLSR